MSCLVFYKHFFIRRKFHLLDLIHNIEPFSCGDLEVISESIGNLFLDIIKQMCRKEKTGHTAHQLQRKKSISAKCRLILYTFLISVINFFHLQIDLQVNCKFSESLQD